MIIEELYYIFEDALKDRKAIETKTKKMHSVIANGIKIQKFPDRIEILNSDNKYEVIPFINNSDEILEGDTH